MPEGLLESLARREVPPVPADLNKRVHQRLNRALLAAHLVDLVLGVVPCLAAEFVRALGYFLKVSLTGRFESRRGDGSREAP
ncbi:MAG: hypothetical protein HY290_10035 [Planctomycetia bacterium]|nr:hypothetical protein [Planctomycetia bacterium]